MFVMDEESMRRQVIYDQYSAMFRNRVDLQNLLSLDVLFSDRWIDLLKAALSSGVAVTPEDLAREFPGMQPFRVDGPVVGCV